VIIHGLSYSYPQAPESLVGRYRHVVPDAVNIGLMHTSLAGSPGHDDYAPCSLAELRATGFTYWALGHVHKRMVAEGPCTIVMPGIPQGRDVDEPGARSATLVTIRADRSLQVEERFTSRAQLERLPIDVTGIEDWNELAKRICHALEHARRGSPSDHLVARLQLAGSTPLAWRIRRDMALLTAEARERARVIGACWVEKVESSCGPPPAPVPESPSDPVMELKRLIEQDVMHSDSFRTQLAAVCEELRRQLPAEARDVLGSDPAAFQDQLAHLAREGIEDALARLHADAPGGG
jgi:DNA repair exonuclease SbcCD nuclease subunit